MPGAHRWALTGPCPAPGVSAGDQLPGAGSGAAPRPAGQRKGTHDVGAQGAEGPCAAGEQVAAVEWQEDLDVVLTVTLGKEGEDVRPKPATRSHR